MPGEAGKAPPALVEVAVKADVLAGYADVYELAPGFDITLTVKDGKIVLERYGLDRGSNERWTSFSVAKSVTATLVGMAAPCLAAWGPARAAARVQPGEAMRISPGNLYYHFRNKDEIVNAIFEDFEREMDGLLATPAHRRVHGYYVLPFLLDDRLVARVDLKADRAAGVLHVPGAFTEDGRDRRRIAAALAAELASMAEWLGLQGVRVGDRGDLAGALAACC